MSSYDINDHEIQLVFMNTEAINIDYWAINRLDFNTCGESHIFDKQKKQMDVAVELESLYLDVDITDPRYFRHTHRLADGDSIRLDGEACIAHIKNSPDITHLCINGTMYRVPWEYESYNTMCGAIAYNNKLQRTSVLKTTGSCETLMVEIRKAVDSVDIYYNQGVEDGKVNLQACEGKDAL